MSTREKIKQAALSLFAKKGFEGTTMNEIADGVGIKKPSLYAHYRGKEELYFAVYEDIAADYKVIMERIFDAVKDMGIEEKLYYIFEQYILYHLANPEVTAFWNRIVFFAPPEVHEKFFSHMADYEARFQQQMEEIFTEGMQQGVVRRDSADKLVWSFRMMREGLMLFMVTGPQLFGKDQIRSFWEDYWQGVRNK